jgi:hypothetical protein
MPASSIPMLKREGEIKSIQEEGEEEEIFSPAI